MQGLKELLDLAERAGATRYYQTPSFGSIAAAGTSAPQPIRFTKPGFVVAMLGQTDLATAVSYAGAALRVQLGGTEDLFVDGQGGPASAPFLELFGGTPNTFRVLRRVAPGTLWVFTVTNNGGNAIVPTVLVAFLADEDLAGALDAVNRLRKAG